MHLKNDAGERFPETFRVRGGESQLGASTACSWLRRR
jgi:hypothetical protein